VLFYFRYLPLKISFYNNKDPKEDTDEIEKFCAVMRALEIKKDTTFVENEGKDFN